MTTADAIILLYIIPLCICISGIFILKKAEFPLYKIDYIIWLIPCFNMIWSIQYIICFLFLVEHKITKNINDNP